MITGETRLFHHPFTCFILLPFTLLPPFTHNALSTNRIRVKGDMQKTTL
ncbi:MAG: hypothetical protein IJ467_04035 [Bacteroidaceae bacterium]|nr:hypothetical protein [Bacteroidaceae bacterium]